MEMLNAQQLLQAVGYPSPLENVAVRPEILYDTVPLVAAQSTYPMFNNPNLVISLRNRMLPLSGSEIFFMTGININISLPFTAANVQNEFFTRSYLEIYVNSKEYIKLPLCEFVSFLYNDTIGTELRDWNRKYSYRPRKLLNPIIFNETSKVDVTLVVPPAIATAYAAANVKVELHGYMFDKLVYFDKGFMGEFEKVSYTMYDTNPVNAAAYTYPLFQKTATKTKNDYSQLLPLSNIQAFQVEAIEFFFMGAGLLGIYNYLKDNFMLTIQVDARKFFGSQCVELFSVIASSATTFSDSGAPVVTTPMSQFSLVRQQWILPEPIILPANGNIDISLTQATATGGVITGFFTSMLKGTMLRRPQ